MPRVNYTVVKWNDIRPGDTFFIGPSYPPSYMKLDDTHYCRATSVGKGVREKAVMEYTPDKFAERNLRICLRGNGSLPEYAENWYRPKPMDAAAGILEIEQLLDNNQSEFERNKAIRVIIYRCKLGMGVTNGEA